MCCQTRRGLLPRRSLSQVQEEHSGREKGDAGNQPCIVRHAMECREVERELEKGAEGKTVCRPRTGEIWSAISAA